MVINYFKYNKFFFLYKKLINFIIYQKLTWYLGCGINKMDEIKGGLSSKFPSLNPRILIFHNPVYSVILYYL